MVVFMGHNSKVIWGSVEVVAGRGQGLLSDGRVSEDVINHKQVKCSVS